MATCNRIPRRNSFSPHIEHLSHIIIPHLMGKSASINFIDKPLIQKFIYWCIPIDIRWCMMTNMSEKIKVGRGKTPSPSHNEINAGVEAELLAKRIEEEVPEHYRCCDECYLTMHLNGFIEFDGEIRVVAYCEGCGLHRAVPLSPTTQEMLKELWQKRGD